MIARIDAFDARSARAMQAPEVRILDEIMESENGHLGEDRGDESRE